MVSPTQVVLAASLVAVFGGIWYFEGRGRWRAALEDRFIYGVPWGTIVLVSIVVAFYLFVQSGLSNWSDPVVFAFVSWSYFYPLGMLTSGIAHGSPAHLIGNMAGTIALAPIAEYAWSHYASGVEADRTADGDADEDAETATDGDAETDADAAVHRTGDEASTAATGANATTESASETRPNDGSDDGPAWDPDDDLLPDPPGYDGGTRNSNGAENGDDGDGLLHRPWIRAVVVFPAAVFLSALLTALFSVQPSLGFSGAVYAIIGFTVVYYPLKTVVAVIATSALGAIWEALANPLVRGAIESGAPAPPSWAGIAFQAHGLGFLLGVLAAVALLATRGKRPQTERVIFGVLGVGLVQGLWLVAWPSGTDSYVLYRGAGMTAFLVVTALVGVAVADRFERGSITRQHVAVGAIVTLTILLALPSLLTATIVVGDGSAPDTNGVEIQGYTVAYADNASSGHELGIGNVPNDTLANQITGVVVVNPERQIWTVGVQDAVLAYSGNESVTVGGVGWHESVRAQRIGWSVAGNGTAFVVDLHHDGDTIRSFTSDPLTAGARIDGYSAAVVPSDTAFRLRVRNGGELVDTVAIPEANASTSVESITLETVIEDGVRHVYMTTEDSRALVAQAETYG